MDSLLDTFASSVNLYSLKASEKPADADHLYGHGKIESLAGFFQSLIISASAIFLVIESVKRLFQGSGINHLLIAIGVMLVSMICTFLLVLKLKSIARKAKSLIMETEALHYTTDFLTNGGIIIALVMVKLTGLEAWDLAIAIGIAGYILKQSVKIFRTSVNELIDRAIPEEEQREIERIILNFDPKITGFHNLRTRTIGEQKFIDFHVQIKGIEGFKRAHELTESLIAKIKERFPTSDVTVHYDPETDRKHPGHSK
jgi:ferrous-iron efflux pump FieF